MSAGAFALRGYQATYGTGTNIHPIRVQPETEALSVTIGGVATLNAGEPADDITNPISAVVSRGRRSIGLNARLIRIRFNGVPPTGYQGGTVISLPALNSALLAAPRGATGTYLGVGIEVVGVTPEAVR